MATETATTPSIGMPRRTASVAGQVVGVVGLVVCLALAVLVLLGRGWAVAQVDAIAASADDGLAQGVPILQAADDRVTDVSGEVQRISEFATTIAAAAAPAPDAAEGLSNRLASVSERYLPLRAGYADGRARLASAMDRVEALSRFVPGVSVPQGPIDALRAVDTAIQTVDERVVALLGTNGEATVVKGTAQRVSTASASLLESLTAVSTRLDEAETRLTEARVNVASTFDTITAALSLGALLLVLALLYGAALHVVLLRSAGGLRRSRTG